MEDEEKTVGADEQSNEEEEKQEQETQDVVATVNAAWEEKTAAMKQEYERRIAERDALIAQLIKGENDPVAADGIVDKVNSRRQYKKW